MSENASVSTLVVEMAANPGLPAGQFADVLRANLWSWAHGSATFRSCESYVLSLRIPDADIDGFSENRGWSVAPDALIQFHFRDSIAALEAQRSGPGVLLPAAALAAADPARVSALVCNESVVFDTMTESERWGAEDETRAPVKLIVLNWKRKDLTLDQFTDHWRNSHAPLVREHGPSMGFCRYVQSHRSVAPSAEATASDQAIGWRESPDGGITEVWFPTHSSMKRDLSSTAGLAASAIFAEDEVKFILPARMSAFLAQETRESLAG